MPRSTIDWKSADSFTRLLAAMVAAQDMKLNYKKIADMYGQGATYDSIEGRFRIIRREAEKLKTEIDSGERPPAPARSETNPSPRRRRAQAEANGTSEGVLSGRIAKSSNASLGTPTKRRATTAKKQALETSTGSSSNGDSSSASGFTGTGNSPITIDDSSFDAYDPIPSLNFDLGSFSNTQSMTTDQSQSFLSYSASYWDEEAV